MEVEWQRVEKSTPDEELRLKHHFKGLRCLFVLKADFECWTAGIDKPEDDEIKAYNYQEHKPCGFMRET